MVSQSSDVVTPATDQPPAITWEDRPAGSSEVLWRSSRNPIIPRDPASTLLPRILTIDIVT